MYLFIYKTIHTNGKYYIGRHSTKKLDDKYLGSGRWVTSIKDKSNLTREYIEFTDTFEELLLLEEYYIKQHYNDPLCMNFNKASIGFTSDYSKQIQQQLVLEGKHHLLRRKDGSSHASDKVVNGTNPWCKRKDGTSVASDKVRNGTHNFLKRINGTSLQTDRVSDGTHHLLGANKGIENPRYSNKTYDFINTDGKIEMNVTQFYMKSKYCELSSGKISLLVNGKRKSHMGWSLMKKT